MPPFRLRVVSWLRSGDPVTCDRSRRLGLSVTNPVRAICTALAVIAAACVRSGIVEIVTGHFDLGLGKFGIAVSLGVINIFVVRNRRAAEQDRRNELAEIIAARATPERTRILAGSSEAPFVLYLRPFFLDGALGVSNDVSGPAAPAFFSEPMRLQFDNYLLICLAHSKTLLLCLGRDDELGAARVRTNDDKWEECFRDLARRAVGIAVVPGRQEGIMREIRWLRVSGLFHKTIFFKPKPYEKGEWELTRQYFLENDGYKFPAYLRYQLSFQLYDTGNLRSSAVWRRRFWSKTDGNAQMANLLTGRPIR